MHAAQLLIACLAMLHPVCICQLDLLVAEYGLLRDALPWVMLEVEWS